MELKMTTLLSINIGSKTNSPDYGVAHRIFKKEIMFNFHLSKPKQKNEPMVRRGVDLFLIARMGNDCKKGKSSARNGLQLHATMSPGQA